MRKADAVRTWISEGSRFTRSRLQMIASLAEFEVHCSGGGERLISDFVANLGLVPKVFPP